MRLWFAIYLAWLIGLALVFQAAFTRFELGDLSAMRYWALAGMGIYMSLCNIFMPMPTTWIVMLVASEGVLPGVSAAGRILLVGSLGALSTAMANLNEYHLLGYFLRARLVRRIRRARVVEWAVRWFDISPFQTLTLISFIPIPVDVVRWLAILRQYPRLRFAGAYFAGRWLRYAGLASLSVGLTLTFWNILAVQACLVGAFLVRVGWNVARRRRMRPAPLPA